jgi:hypothetical protein
MEEAVASGRGRWSTALGLTLAVVLLSVFDALALVLLPLAILAIGLPTENRLRWSLLGILLWLTATLLSVGPLSLLSRGWALMAGAIFFALSMARPNLDVITRALITVGAGLGLGGLVLLTSGQAAELDAAILQHFEMVATVTVGDLQTRMPESAWVAELRDATAQIGELQARFFPALLGLQSLAALALASWWTRRIGRSDSPAFELAPLRDFRFNDELIWILIAALVLSLLPLGEPVTRIGLNGLVFMGALYALRGLAVFVFLATGSRSIATMVLGALALVFLYPVAFTAALLMGVGDTWLDVRRRVALARPT